MMFEQRNAVSMVGKFLGITVAAFAPMPAMAGVSNLARSPTSASVPCSGTLQETFTEGGNVHNAFSSMTLTCLDGPVLKWKVAASVGCGTGDDSEMGKRCDSALADPLGQFRKVENKERVHVYRLVKYVFATGCTLMPVKRTRMQAVTNKVIGKATTENMAACRDVRVVDGTSDPSFQQLEPKAYRYARITTTGAPEETTDGPGESELLGVQDYDFTYRVKLTEHGSEKD